MSEGFTGAIPGLSLGEMLGEGRRGWVYKAVQPNGEVCAVKILKNAADATDRQRMAREATTLESLGGVHAPRFLGKGETPQPYIVMELIDGDTVERVFTRSGNRLSPPEVVRLLDSILEALAWLHGRHIVHRDLKADNILIERTTGSAKFIDFGACKPEVHHDDLHTWDKVGGDQHSPPRKLKHPGLAEPRHDVFAVGVIAYRLLSGVFPWRVTGGDRGDLQEIMRLQRPHPLLGFQVPPALHTYMMSLLETDDSLRPDAQEARMQLTRASSGPSDETIRTAMVRAPRPLCPRVTRDPVHGDIRLTNAEWSVINTPTFQRLGYIRQLGLAHYVYRGATHSRMLHSLGTLHRVEQMITAAEDGYNDYLDEEVRLLARMYALVHDIAHLPFGHTLEDECGLFPRHDHNRARLERMLTKESALRRVLESTPFGKLVLEDLLNAGESQLNNSVCSDLVSSTIGADVLDYIDRDASACGLDERVDSAVLRKVRMALDRPGRMRLAISLVGRHGKRADAVSALRSVLEARYSLFEKVYSHRMKNCAGAMLGRAVYVATGTQSGCGPEFLESDIETMGDDDLISLLKRSERPEARYLAERLWNRDLYAEAFSAALVDDQQLIGDNPARPHPEEMMKRLVERTNDRVRSRSGAHEVPGVDFVSPEGRAAFEHVLAEAAGLECAQVLMHFPPRAPGFKRIKPILYHDGGRIRNADQRIDQLHADVRSRHVALWKCAVYVTPGSSSVVGRIAKAMVELTGLKNELPIVESQG